MQELQRILSLRLNWFIYMLHLDGKGGLEKEENYVQWEVNWQIVRKGEERHVKTQGKNTLTDTVIFSDPHFTVSPANNPYNLTILRNQNIAPSNLNAIWHSEMKHIKAQVESMSMCVCVTPSPLISISPLHFPPPLFLALQERNSWVNNSPEFIQNYDSVC